MSEGLFSLSGRVAVLTGGTTGLGREIALGMAAAGADVVPSSRRQQQVDACADEIEALGRRTLRMTCDVLDRGSLERLHDGVQHDESRHPSAAAGSLRVNYSNVATSTAYGAWPHKL